MLPRIRAPHRQDASLPTVRSPPHPLPRPQRAVPRHRLSISSDPRRHRPARHEPRVGAKGLGGGVHVRRHDRPVRWIRPVDGDILDMSVRLRGRRPPQPEAPPAEPRGNRSGVDGARSGIVHVGALRHPVALVRHFGDPLLDKGHHLQRELENRLHLHHHDRRRPAHLAHVLRISADDAGAVYPGEQGAEEDPSTPALVGDQRHPSLGPLPAAILACLVRQNARFGGYEQLERARRNYGGSDSSQLPRASVVPHRALQRPRQARVPLLLVSNEQER